MQHPHPERSKTKVLFKICSWSTNQWFGGGGGGGCLSQTPPPSPFPYLRKKLSAPKRQNTLEHHGSQTQDPIFLLLPPSYLHTWLLIEEFLECSSFTLDGMFLQVGLKALNGVVHHVHFHQAQDLENPPDTENKIYPERKSSERGAYRKYH